jgi:hypothetical protein
MLEDDDREATGTDDPGTRCASCGGPGPLTTVGGTGLPVPASGGPGQPTGVVGDALCPKCVRARRGEVDTGENA